MKSGIRPAFDSTGGNVSLAMASNSTRHNHTVDNTQPLTNPFSGLDEEDKEHSQSVYESPPLTQLEFPPRYAENRTVYTQTPRVHTQRTDGDTRMDAMRPRNKNIRERMSSTFRTNNEVQSTITLEESRESTIRPTRRISDSGKIKAETDLPTESAQSCCNSVACPCTIF